MNVLFLSTKSPYPLISGHSLRTYNTLKGAAQKHNVTLITFCQHPEHELKEENLAHLRSFCKAVYTYPIPSDQSRIALGMALVRSLISPKPFVAMKYDTPAMRGKIRNIIATEQINLVHVDMLPLSVYLNEFLNHPKIIVNHNVESVRLYRWFETERNPLKKLFLGFQWFKLRSFERNALNSFDSCITVSEIDKQLLQGMGVTKPMVVVPNGTDTEFFKPMGRRPIENSVMWFGHMDVHTNRDAVLYFWRDICPLLRKCHPEIIISFVGTAPPQEIVDAAKADPQVRVTGFVDDIRPYVDEAAVVVVPIRIGSGTRLKILDAMAMGKAIVTTSVGCEGISVSGDNNILIADEPETFAQKVHLLISEREKRIKLEQKARLLAKEYDWKKIVTLQEATYEMTVTKGGPYA